MKKISSGLILWFAISAVAAFGQDAAAPLVFEAVDLHASTAAPDWRFGGLIPGGRFEARGMTVLGLISMAYSLPADRIVGGPAWVDTNRFDINAKVPAGTTEAAVPAMLQAMLAERFKLAVHNDNKDLPIFVLLPGKKPLLKANTAGGESDCRMSVTDVRTFTCTNMTMDSFALRLPPVSAAYLNHPLINKTGLTGAFDFAVHWTGRNAALASNGDDPPARTTVFEAVDKQLGLKIEPQQQSMAILVVDHVDEKPTPNDPSLTKAMPPVPTEFEVGEIKPSKPDTKSRGNITNGRVEIFGITLKDILTMSYDKEDDEVAGPKWMDTDHFDVVAKAPGQVGFDVMQGMLQKLVVEAFQLKFHEEKQPMSVFALSMGKRNAKLKDADPANRSECTRSAGDGIVSFICKNTTMAQLAEKIKGAAGGYLDKHVVDLTNLSGAFDFTLTWTPAQLMGYGPRADKGKTATDTATASTPTGGITIFDAFDKQLGLKLEPQKYPMPVMVVDRAEKPKD
jgi:uncharacterized protein (TIGR03435 family)